MSSTLQHPSRRAIAAVACLALAGCGGAEGGAPRVASTTQPRVASTTPPRVASTTPPRVSSTNPPQSLPDEVVIVCDADGETIDVERVRPQRDGVHVVVDNRLDHDPGFQFSYKDGGGGGRNTRPGEKKTIVIDAGPGVVEMACGFPDGDDAEHVQVVDPKGLYVDSELDCLRVVTATAGYAELPAGHPDPEEAARKRLDFGMERGDELVRAGYPASRVPVFMVVRNGEVVAKTELARGTKGWYADGYSACEGFGHEN